MKNFLEFSKFWGKYSSSSSIHGVQYIGQRHWIESLFWISALLVSFTGCTILIWNVYEKRQSSPVIVSFNEKSTPVWQIPFPAVTICPETKALKNNIDFTKWFHLVNDSKLTQKDAESETFKTMEAMTHVCDASLFKNMNFSSGIPSEDITETLYNIAPDLRETLDICRWKNKLVDCEKLFIESITDEGTCYTFNSLVLSQIYAEKR